MAKVRTMALRVKMEAGGSVMALCTLTTRKHLCNIGKEETRLIKEVLVTLGAGEFGEGSHPPLLF